MANHKNDDNANSAPKSGGANTALQKSYKNNKTVLVTPTRLTKSNTLFANTSNHRPVSHTGWVSMKPGTGGRAGRVQSEVLVTLNSPVAANANSGLPYFAKI